MTSLRSIPSEIVRLKGLLGLILCRFLVAPSLSSYRAIINRRSFISAFVLIGISGASVSQGLDAKASKDDWEEINFEFNSSVLVDGYPSLLRVAELLQKHPGYKVRIEGHTDIIGNVPYNEKLGQARADSVRDFLVKYGASAGRITTGTRGKVDPKYLGQMPTFRKTDEARWMNRRVVLTVMNKSGVVGAGGPGDAIRTMEPREANVTDYCKEGLKGYEELDDIARLPNSPPLDTCAHNEGELDMDFVDWFGWLKTGLDGRLGALFPLSTAVDSTFGDGARGMVHTGRAMVHIQLGNLMRPKGVRESGSVSRVRYGANTKLSRGHALVAVTQSGTRRMPAYPLMPSTSAFQSMEILPLASAMTASQISSMANEMDSGSNRPGTQYQILRLVYWGRRGGVSSDVLTRGHLS